MAGKNLDFWYDEQIKRYLIQLVRIFSNFKVKELTSDGIHYNRVPARYADMSRMVAHMLRNNSENIVNNAPQITVGIQSIQPARDRAQDPFLQDTQQVAEREWDKELGAYTSNQGNLYTTKRYMPVPYNLTVQVDIWTTNTDTKLQILEQIFVIFNPSIQLQSNDNPLDWSSVFEVEMQDIQWSSRSLPAGVDESLDIATLTFLVPIWISPPAKVQRQQIIQSIINDIYKTESIQELGYSSAYYDFFDQVPKTGTIVVAPDDLKVRVENGSAVLVDNMGVPQPWNDIIEMLGELSSTSRLELNTTSDPSNLDELVIGSVVANPLLDSSLIFNLDVGTLATNTVANVDRIIDPATHRPNNGLSPAGLGQRYLLVGDILTAFQEWGQISASEHDIIEYDGTKWVVAFDSSNVTTDTYVSNNYTNQQYKWTGSQWISSWQGEYNPGFWRLIL